MEYSDNQWTSWLVPMIVVATVAMFIVTMLVNNCPKENNGFQGAKFLGRLSFHTPEGKPTHWPFIFNVKFPSFSSFYHFYEHEDLIWLDLMVIGVDLNGFIRYYFYLSFFVRYCDLWSCKLAISRVRVSWPLIAEDMRLLIIDLLA